MSIFLINLQTTNMLGKMMKACSEANNFSLLWIKPFPRIGSAFEGFKYHFLIFLEPHVT